MPWIFVREWFTPPGRKRVPEPMVMEEEEAVAGFSDASETVDGLLAVYSVSTRAINTMLPEGGQVVDIGCGAGEFLRTVAERRPDCRVLGLDLSGPMVERTRGRIQRDGIADRASVVQADATALPDEALPERIDVVTCLNLLHQFPDTETLDRCLREIARLRARHDCAVWILDLARVKNGQTLPQILEVTEPNMSAIAIRNTLESEAAAFTVPELKERLEASGLRGLKVAADVAPGLWQAHWTKQAKPTAPAATHRWVEPSLPLKARMLARLFRGLPSTH